MFLLAAPSTGRLLTYRRPVDLNPGGWLRIGRPAALHLDARRRGRTFRRFFAHKLPPQNVVGG